MSGTCWSRLLIVIPGLLCLIIKPVMAVPLLQSDMEPPVSDFSFSDVINNLVAGNRFDWNKLNFKAIDDELVFSEIINSEILFSELQSLHSSGYLNRE